MKPKKIVQKLDFTRRYNNKKVFPNMNKEAYTVIHVNLGSTSLYIYLDKSGEMISSIHVGKKCVFHFPSIWKQNAPILKANTIYTNHLIELARDSDAKIIPFHGNYNELMKSLKVEVVEKQTKITYDDVKELGLTKKEFDKIYT